jgi:hypothetical protein
MFLLDWDKGCTYISVSHGKSFIRGQRGKFNSNLKNFYVKKRNIVIGNSKDEKYQYHP